MSVKRAALIVVEGVDKCGKTTQCRLLVEKLNERGVRAKYKAFPDRLTLVGKLINKYLTKQQSLSNHEIHLLFSLNRWEFKKEIERDLDAGITLIFDRYSYSGIAYSAVKEGMDFEFCFATEVGLPQPDVVVFLKGSVLTMAERQGFGEEVYEEVGFQSKVKDFYEHHFFPFMRVISAEGSIDEVNQRLEEIAIQTTDSVGTDQLQNLSWKDMECLDEKKLEKYQYMEESFMAIVDLLKISNSELDDDRKMVRVLEMITSMCPSIMHDDDNTGRGRAANVETVVH